MKNVSQLNHNFKNKGSSVKKGYSDYNFIHNKKNMVL